MSTDKNVQTVKDFFAAIGRGDKQGLLALVAEDIEWIIPGEDWPARTAGTRDWRKCFGRLPSRWKRHTQSLPNSSRRETGFWSSASLRGKSKPRIGRSGTTGSSPSPFKTAR